MRRCRFSHADDLRRHLCTACDMDTGSGSVASGGFYSGVQLSADMVGDLGVFHHLLPEWKLDEALPGHKMI